AAFRFSKLGCALSRMVPSIPVYEEIDDRAITGASLLLHYARNGFYIPENYILENVAKLGDLPVWLLHGRFDFDCCLSQAFELQAALPQLNLHICAGGHSVSEPEMNQGFQQMLKDVL